MPVTVLAEPNIREKSETDRQSIYAHIRSSITDGRLAPGAKLPTERELCLQFRAARNTVRKAMKALEDEGLVQRHVGRGTYVADLPASPRMPEGGSGAVASLAEILEARLLFEPALADLVVERADQGDLEGMERHLAAMLSAKDWRSFKEAKYALHLAFAAASRNRFLVQVFEAIIAARREANWGRSDVNAPPSPVAREAAWRANRAIVDALKTRDAEAARTLIRDYLVRTLTSVMEI